MKINEIRKLTDEELVNKIKETKKTLFDLRMKHATGTLDKPSDLRNTRKTVARMKTILKERQLEKGKADKNGK
ncbi:MAG TPA: 50S ribosomal protein L29 [Bacilli bacterium]|nr:50S ribosomal protein L29 [Bacilli bacterium]